MAACNSTEVTRQALDSRALPLLAERGWDVPRYPRDGAPCVVHLGLGGFHRAHQAMVFDRLLRLGDQRWGVLAVGMHQHKLADSLSAQDCLFALGQSDPGGTRWELMGSIWRTAVAAHEPGLVREALAATATRWVTLTVTEKGYSAELAGLLVDALALRRDRALQGMTLASCDNQRGNGDVLRELCLSLARNRDANLADWIAEDCAFPNSMVDRIVPTPTDALREQAGAALGVIDTAAVGTEAFWEWVIEDRFTDPGDALALARVGVRVVPNVRPYEDAKLRMLNGSHSAMACIGVVLGLTYVHQAVADPDVARFLQDLFNLDVGPGLDRPDWPAYRDTLMERFSNPALRHGLHQICNDASKKIPHRWVPAALDALRAGRMPRRLAFAAAAWMRYLIGVDESGRAYPLNDPMADPLQALARSNAGDPCAVATALGALTDVWGAELPQQREWMACVAYYRHRIDQVGLRATLATIESSPTSSLVQESP